MIEDSGIAREVFLGLSTGSKVIFYLLSAVAVIICVWGILQRIKKYRRGRKGKELSNIFGRTIETAKICLSNMTIIRDDIYSGVSHILIFWGFIVLFTGSVVVALNADVLALIDKRWVFLDGLFYLWFSFTLDLFGLAFLGGIIAMAVRRAFVKPDSIDYTRLDREIGMYSRGSYVVGDWVFLGGLMGIAITGFLVEGLRILITHPVHAPWSFVGYFISNLLQGIVDPGYSGMVAFKIMWWTHGFISLAFVAYLPYSKAVHMITDVASVFCKQAVAGAIQPMTDDELDFEQVGHMKVEHFTRTELLTLDACTKCGRCHVWCPAVISKSSLSPRDIILDLRDYVTVKSGNITLWDTEKVPYAEGKVVGGLIQEQTLWSCTTCGSCMEHCPVSIDHVPFLVKMRRHLIEGGFIDEGIQEALTNISECGNSFGEPDMKRGQWVQNLDVKIKDARKEEVDVLWFVGDFASFDNRAVEATKAFARVMSLLKVDFGILYEGERNAGNDVRRVGEEGLFEELVEQNVELLNNCQFNRIVTTDPHSMNVLKNEYPNFNKPVLHYTELLAQILGETNVSLEKIDCKVTYHDPCYLGRYNNVYQDPRNVLARLGVESTEMSHSKRDSTCCGAGGGQIWVSAENHSEQRMSELRVKEAVETGAEYLVVACPKCLVMLEDAVKALNLGSGFAVKDISELVLESMLKLT